MHSQIRAYVFDVGETLIDESRIWMRWAARLGVPASTFLGLIGAQAATDQPLMRAFELVQPGFDLGEAEAEWAADEPHSLRSGFDAQDLYPDVIPAFTKLRQLGCYVIVAGNQPPAALAALQAMELPVNFIANSAEIGFEKPDPRFYAAVIERAAALDPALADPARLAYVGDRLDNDVLPAAASGLIPVLIRRGPWGYLHADRLAGRDRITGLARSASQGIMPDGSDVTIIDSLLELPISPPIR